MRPMTMALRKYLEKQSRMRRCLIAQLGLEDLYGRCSGRISNPEWHHVWTYGGPQINEPWAIFPACTGHHDMVKTDRAVKAVFETASLILATAEDLAKYPRKKWDQIKKSLGLCRRNT